MIRPVSLNMGEVITIYSLKNRENMPGYIKYEDNANTLKCTLGATLSGTYIIVSTMANKHYQRHHNHVLLNP